MSGMPGLDEATLAQLRALWELAPPGTPVRLFTEPLARGLVGTVGPAESRDRADRHLGGTDAAYRAALALKALAGEVDVLLHAVGIAAALPHVLAPDERVLGLSLDHDSGGAGEGVLGDLVTDQKIAEFTFIQWAPKGGNGMREAKLLRDLIKLDLIDDAVAEGRRRVLYVTGGAPARRFLQSRQTIRSKLAKHADVLGRYEANYGAEAWPVVGAYWSALVEIGRVELVDLCEVTPDLAPLTG
jgi:hypothetical protein